MNNDKQEASETYEAAVRTAREAYNAAVRTAEEAYEATVRTAREAYDDVVFGWWAGPGFSQAGPEEEE